MITTTDTRRAFETKNGVQFRSGKELNGWIYHDGMRIARITVSKGNKDIPKGTHRSMARSLGISETQLTEYVQCKIKGTKLVDLILDSNHCP